jgi:outer membrane protein assembly factor BamB
MPILYILRSSPRLAFCLTFLMSLWVGTGWAQVSVLTQHNDNSRTGANLNETSLNTSNVNVSTFGKLFSMPVDGFVFAQPLYMPGVGTHNVLFVATAHDSVYAFDADTGAQLWKKSLGTPVPSSVINTPNIQVEVGIISTPVIDPSTNTLYVVPKTYENSVQIYRLHALIGL